MNHLNHPTFSQEYLNLLHKENGMELNQAEHRIPEMGSTSGRIKTPGVGRRGYKQWCQPGIPGYRRVEGSLYSNDRCRHWNILPVILPCWSGNWFSLLSEELGYLFLRWSVSVRTLRTGSLTSWRQKVAEPPLVSTGGKNKIISGSPAGLESELPSLTEERKLKTSPPLVRWKGGRMRNMRIPTVNTSQCNIEYCDCQFR